MAYAIVLRRLRQEMKLLTWHHGVVFFITFLMYAIYHACRKEFSNIKDPFFKSRSPINSSTYPYDIWQKETMFTDKREASVFLGELDFLFLISYGFAMFFSGMIADRIDVRYVLASGIIGTGMLAYISMGLSADLGINSKMFYRVLFFLHGLVQSTGWPCLVTVMGNWFSKSSSGFVFGIWGVNAYVGNVIGSLVVTFVLDYGFEKGVLLNSLLALCGGVIVFVCLIPNPKDVGLPSPDEKPYCIMERSSSQTTLCSEMSEKNSTTTNEMSEPLLQVSLKGEPRAITFYEACVIPGVLPYSFAYACLKMVTYAFFFWLPTYLTQGLDWNDALSNNISNFYDVGVTIGSIVSGVVSDFIGYRSPVVSVMLVLSFISVYCYHTFGTTYVTNVVLMVVCGVSLGGPANLFTSVICADLGKHERLGGQTQALATVSGIVNGSGSLGAAIGQLAVGFICKHGGWVWVFYFLMIMIGISFLLVVPMLLKDMKQCCRAKGEVLNSED